MLIVLPSVVSGIGVLLILLGIIIDDRPLREISLSLGVVLLWLDFFITMAIFRRTVRDIDGKLRRIDERLSKQ